MSEINMLSIDRKTNVLETLAFELLNCIPCGSDGKESACDAGDLGSIPGFGISPGEGNGNQLHYFCLENSMVWEAWEAAVNGAAESDTS